MIFLPAKETDRIENEAEQLLESVFGDMRSVELPVDLNVVLNHLGLSLKEGSFEDSTITAALDRADKTIFVSSEDDTHGKYFSIAHEIAHFHLHDHIETDVLYRNQVNSLVDEGDIDEIAASRFAASLLMPEQLITELWDVLDEVDKMSKIFAVSPAMMRYRLKQLDLIKGGRHV
jgi:Zn-dependent peptidase ImmA (M78 family)